MIRPSLVTKLPSWQSAKPSILERSGVVFNYDFGIYRALK